MIASAPLAEDLWQELFQICKARGVKWLVSVSHIQKSKIYRLLGEPTDVCVPTVHDHLRWVIKQDWDREPKPPPLPDCLKEPDGWLQIEQGGTPCPACTPARPSSHVDIRLPVGPPSRERVGDEVRGLLRHADELKGRWEIDPALMLTHFAYDRRHAMCRRFTDAVELLRIAAKVAELSRRSGDPARCRELYDRYFLPAALALGDFARHEGEVLSVSVAVPVVKELVALENESYTTPARGTWARRVAWLRAATTRHATRLAEADPGEHDSVRRQLALTEIPRRLSPRRPAVSPPGSKVRAAAPLHYYGLRNLQAIEFFEWGQPTAAVAALADDYAQARRQIFAVDGSLAANEGERSTMMGMALYLGVALWKTRGKGRGCLPWEQCLADSRRIYEYSGGRARCIVTPAVRDSAAGCERAVEYLSQLDVGPPATDLTDRVEQVWELIQGQLPSAL